MLQPPPSLNLPPFDSRMMAEGAVQMIFDVFRKKYVALTPEEWVRQHFAHYLVNHLHYPKAWLKIECALAVNGQKKRADIVAFGKDTQPFLVVECKSYEVKLSERTFQQSALYNHTLQAPYLAITNGLRHYCCRIDQQQQRFEFQSRLPTYG
ncbi:type I restriction enzyme HsdR N-terminal domain-containing protein [Tunicatimonas pelagia]|uniref:type I restriction enzyme HsdR N-terminal domain-containing protein n=1 Tax=Tunicatimonas pelagia TaxID=931531 RepID=UPI002666BFB8|nr:type I restriction enzyme HsdR N-terminal domain-containing protein [Tunicatimonas pelagia]WKN41257.1 type I restriction enzyme HsdR N-terminal domain-containing protein [Tunicatimonas pelagia]